MSAENEDLFTASFTRKRQETIGEPQAPHLPATVISAGEHIGPQPTEISRRTVATVARIITADRVVPKVRSRPLHPDTHDYESHIVTNRDPAWGPHPTPYDLPAETVDFDMGDGPPAPRPPVTFVS